MQQDEVDHIKTRSETRYHSYAPPKRSTPRVQVGCCVVAVAVCRAGWRSGVLASLSRTLLPNVARGPSATILQRWPVVTCLSLESPLIAMTTAARRPLPVALCLQGSINCLVSAPGWLFSAAREQRRALTAEKGHNCRMWNCQERKNKSGNSEFDECHGEETAH